MSEEEGVFCFNCGNPDNELRECLTCRSDVCFACATEIYVCNLDQCDNPAGACHYVLSCAFCDVE